MNTVHTPAAAVLESRPAPGEPEPIPTPPTPNRLVSRLVAATMIAALGLAAWIFQDQLRATWVSVTARFRTGEPGEAAGKPHQVAIRPKAIARLVDGKIVLPERSRIAMGLATTAVLPQTDPIRLELLGTTEYITDTVTEVRPMFKGRVDKVHVAVNQAVKKGDPLVDLYSKDLAEAKSAYEIEHIQWVHDRKLLETREKLIKSNAITQFLYEETRNDEMKSHKEYEVARDKLMVYGLSDAEVQRVEEQAGAEKARITLRSPSDGFVIARNVVPGNLYDENDTLLTVAPLDRLWVWGQVFESDLDLVRVGQSWEVSFPYLKDKVLGKVEYVSNRVDPNTHAVRVRTSIPNTMGRLKSDMLVQGTLAIDAVPGRTVIPRTALVVDGSRFYVFVRVANHPDQFERRLIDVAQEKDDHVVVESGLKLGDEVVHVGGLLLAQLHDDLQQAASGAPVAPAGASDD